MRRRFTYREPAPLNNVPKWSRKMDLIRQLGNLSGTRTDKKQLLRPGWKVELFTGKAFWKSGLVVYAITNPKNRTQYVVQYYGEPGTPGHEEAHGRAMAYQHKYLQTVALPYSIVGFMIESLARQQEGVVARQNFLRNQRVRVRFEDVNTTSKMQKFLEPDPYEKSVMRIQNGIGSLVHGLSLNFTTDNAYRRAILELLRNPKMRPLIIRLGKVEGKVRDDINQSYIDNDALLARDYREFSTDLVKLVRFLQAMERKNRKKTSY